MGRWVGGYYFGMLNILKKEKLADINRRIQNSSKFYQIMKGILADRKIMKQCKTTIFKVYSKLALSYNTKTKTIIKQNKSRIKAMDINNLRSIEETE
jgi:hypothetical protein